MNDNTTKHLEFIQNIITRMNTNSFQIKGMSVTITAALLTLYAGSNKPLYLAVPIIPTILFWFLDAYYLQQERKFRAVYNDVAELSKPKHRINVRPFEMPLQKYTDGKYFYLDVFWSKTIWPFYLIPITVLLYTTIIFIRPCG
jgi:hypothetical protein